MSGWFKLHRGWMDSPDFAPEPLTEREAWLWLIEQAAWEPTRTKVKGTIVNLERGQLSFSVRFMAEKWQWSKSRVDRFLKRLSAENMIFVCSKIGTTAGHPAGHGQSVITICNYSKYQDVSTDERDNDGQEIGTTAGQQRDKEEEGKKERIKEEAADAAGGYLFHGRVIKLNAENYRQWERSYPDLHLPSVLQSRDDWLSENGKLKNWFLPTSNHLAKLQRDAADKRRQKVEAGNAIHI